MNWVPLNPNINLDDKPRLLTEKEIEFLVAHLPKTPAADEASANITRNGIVEWLKKNLQEVKLAPSAIPALAQRIQQTHNKSLVQAGAPVGITAAEAVGATTTQTTLNTFHTSGSSKSIAGGIDAMRDIVYARKDPKNPACYVFFNNQQASYKDVLNTRISLVGSMFSDFILDYEIAPPETLKQYWWHNPEAYRLLNGRELPHSKLIMRLHLNLPMMYKHRVSIGKLAQTLTLDPFHTADIVYGPMEDGIIDIHPILDEITEQLKNPKGSRRDKASMFHPEIAELTYLKCIVEPELKNIRVKGISGITNIIPIRIPLLSLLLSEEKMLKTDDPEQLYGPYDGSMWKLTLDNTKMKMYGLTSKNFASLVVKCGLRIEHFDSEHILMVRRGHNHFKLADETPVLFYNGSYYQKSSNIVLIDGNLYKQVSGDNVRQIDDHFELLIAPNYYEPVKIEIYQDQLYSPILLNNYIQNNYQEFTFQKELYAYLEKEGFVWEKLAPVVKVIELSPQTIINMKIKEQKDNNQYRKGEIKNMRINQAKLLSKDEADDLLSQPIELEEEAYDLIRASEFYYGETEGINFKELLNHPMVNKKLTSCNNMYVIAETLGIEAARKFIAKRLYDIINNNGSYVHPSNILLIAEFFTSRGEPHGATYTGISRQPAGHLSLATIERAASVFTENALYARKEDVRNLSAAIVMGARCAIGDGYFDVGYDIKKEGKEINLINDDIGKGFKESEDFIEVKSNKIDEAELLDVNLMDENFDALEGEKEADLFKVFDDVKGEINLSSRDIRQFKPIKPVNLSNLRDDSFVKMGVPQQEKINILMEKEVQLVQSQGLRGLEGEIVKEKEELPIELQRLLKQFIKEEIKMIRRVNLPAYEKDLLPNLDDVFNQEVLDWGAPVPINPVNFILYANKFF